MMGQKQCWRGEWEVWGFAAFEKTGHRTYFAAKRRRPPTSSLRFGRRLHLQSTEISAKLKRACQLMIRSVPEPRALVFKTPHRGPPGRSLRVGARRPHTIA